MPVLTKKQREAFKKRHEELTAGKYVKPEGKSKADIVKEKSFVAKQKIKEAKKAPTKIEKKDLDANKKKETKTIHSSKGIDVEIKKKPKARTKPEKKYQGHVGVIKERKDKLEQRKEDIKKHGTATPEKHPAHRPKPKQKPKGAQAAEVGKGGKSPGPKERKKLPKISGKAREDAKRAAIREEARKPKKKEAKKQAETGTRETSYEARVKALVAKKASLSKKETADGRSEYQVQMNKLKKENKKAWKKMFKGGKLKG
jgi:hypothetical protein